MMPYCSNCGRRIYADDNFCSGCGQPVSRVATPSPISSSASPAVTEGRRQARQAQSAPSRSSLPENYSFSSSSTPGPAKGGSSAGKLISIIVILIFLTTFIVFIAGFLGTFRNFW